KPKPRAGPERLAQAVRPRGRLAREIKGEPRHLLVVLGQSYHGPEAVAPQTPSVSLDHDPVGRTELRDDELRPERREWSREREGREARGDAKARRRTDPTRIEPLQPVVLQEVAREL